MKKRFKKTKRETLKGLIIKTALAALGVCVLYAQIQWILFANMVSYQLNEPANVDWMQEDANRISNSSGIQDKLDQFENMLACRAFNEVHINDIYRTFYENTIINPSFMGGTSNSSDYIIGSYNRSPGCHSVAVVLDENNNVVASGTERILLRILFDKNDNDNDYYVFKKGENKEADIFWNDIMTGRQNSLFMNISVKSAYVNRMERTFIPCKARLEGYGANNEVVVQRDFSVTIDNDNYELIEFRNAENNAYPATVGNAWACGENQEDIDRIAGYFDLKFNSAGISDKESYDKLMTETDLYHYDHFYIWLDNKEYSVYLINTLKYKTPEFYRIYLRYVIIFVLVVIIISTFVCRHKYYKNKMKYAMEDYERNLTNHLAHDMKTPLMAIGGYAVNILDGKLTEDEKKEYLEAIIENVEFADSTMSRALMLNSMDGSTGLKYETTDVGNVVSEAVKKYEPLLEQNDISFSLEGSAQVKAESTSFEKIVENLISNAVKYTPESGSIKAMIDKNKMVISNTVNGKIDTRKLKDPFVRGEESRSNLGGSGLGLSIAERAAILNDFSLNISCTENEFKAEVKF
jgi:hypothetical protein